MNICIVTGANSGMGMVTIQALLERGDRVIATVRSEKKATLLVQMLREHGVSHTNLEIEIVQLDQLESVRRFADHLFEQIGRIDRLILNAGVMVPPYHLTKDGFESQFQVNYLSHFYLIERLLPLLQHGNDPRVISISSLAGEGGLVRTDIELESIAHVKKEQYNPMRSYRESKLLQMVHMRELADKYGDDVTFVSVHPGIVNTDLFYRGKYGKAMKVLLKPIAQIGYWTGKLYTPEYGAKTALYLATTNDRLDNGGYYADSAPRLSNPVVEDTRYREDARRLSKKWVGLD
ncbi:MULTISPECIES: SDR family NAD(P)-dependent oxidoreductase [unclassified Exiguobacterium]|uniref:SDR family NAD(P)-dependent oxidoreductase n=1 Tax=unclassified Exiguobacterium TaxID=2644629 RepID=UPI000B58BB18|nr:MULTISPECIES: SDR family NAD(P)-dependent oxidoreductase [unclassified Exiguobacterium]ASI35502.1 short-chain dehydrogenase [Exiguobacterium sp. N4-1P]ASI37511.1 short-chain dehydrogenase [Exiguobacterium sp. N4-1P]